MYSERTVVLGLYVRTALVLTCKGRLGEVNAHNFSIYSPKSFSDFTFSPSSYKTRDLHSNLMSASTSQ